MTRLREHTTSTGYATMIKARSTAAMFAVLCAVLFAATPPAIAQDANFGYPVPTIEQRLKNDPFNILDFRGSRRDGDRTSRATLAFQDSSVIIAKWAKAPSRVGEVFNNVPRYEVAAYELQKLFLTPAEYVVPPTVMRAFDITWYQTIDPLAAPTFDGTRSVIVVLQYWLANVESREVFDRRRFDRDTAYAHHLANLNVLTHLIRHNDANVGNILISTDTLNPRLFAVDNGVAFEAEASNRGTTWRDLRVNRIPASTVERLRGLTRESLARALGVVAEFEIIDGRLLPAAPTAPIDDGGTRRSAQRVQFGLTPREIDSVWDRLQNLLRRVEQGRISTFQGRS